MNLTNKKAAFSILAWISLTRLLVAQETAFTYQGRLNYGTNSTDGIFDMQFAIYNALTNGEAYGSLTNSAMRITNGLLLANLDFGQVFNGSNYWLEISVRTNGGGAYNVLSPRQQITRTPYAVYAATAANASSVAAANIVGTFPSSQLPASVVTNNETGVILSGAFSGNGSGLTNLSANDLASGTIPDSSLSTNVAFVDAFFTDQSISYPTTTTDMGFGVTLTHPDYPFYGTINTVYIPAAMTANTLQLYIGAVTNNTPAILRLFVASSLPSGTFTVSSMTSAFTTNILVQLGTNGQAQNFPISLPLSGNVYVMASVMTAATNQLRTAWYYDYSANTNGSRYPLWFASDTNTYGHFYPVSYSFAAASARIDGVQKTFISSGGGSASSVSYSSSSSGLSATNVQTAIDTLVYPVSAANSLVVVDGDSKSVGLYNLLTNNWFAQCQKSLLGVGGTSLSFAKATWETNAATYASRVGGETNGIFILWSGHNDVDSVNPYTEIQTLSNLLAEVVSSNFLPVVITTQPLASYNTDNGASYLFTKIFNNYIRLEPMIWRVVDAETMMPDNYDSRYFVDTTHLTSSGYSIIANELTRQIGSAYKVVPPQSWIGLYGTNMVCAVPNSNGPAITLFTANGAGFINFNGSVAASSFSGNGAGLTNLPVAAITGGINTNITIGGHTLFVTNGIIMNIQ